MQVAELFAGPEYERRPERASHGLVVEVPGGADVDAALRACAVAVPAFAEVRVWPVTLAVGRDHPDARRWRERELARPVPPGGPPVRLVLARYAGAATDLVVVAHRARLGRAALDDLARALAGGGAGARTLTGPARYQPGPPVPPAAAPAFGLGQRSRRGRYASVEMPAGRLPDPATALAAVALVLDRYGETEPVGLVAGAASPGGRDRVSTVDLPVEEGDTIQALRSRAGQPGRAGPAAPVAVGVVVTDSVPNPAPPFPITVAWWSGGARCLFDEGHLDPAVAAGFARCVAAALAQLETADPGTPVGDLALLSDADADAVRAAGGVPARPPATGSTVDRAIAAMARRRPDAPACSDGSATLTYRELDARAGRLARALRGHGARPGARVGVCLERGVELVVVLLAVLKTGAAYVPMDSRAPAERLRFTVEDAAPVVVVSDQAGFPAGTGVPVVAPAALRDGGGDGLPEEAGPGDAAYVIYTSGSTGRPKGVVVPHRNVLALLAATAGDLGLGPEDTWSWFHSSAFDFSVWEIWGALLTGGRVACVPYWVSRSPDAFRDLLARERVTVLSQTPSAFTMLRDADADAGATGGGLAVRLVVFGGEPLDVTTLRPWLQRYPHTRCRLVNMFGITETTVHVTARTLSPADVAEGSRSVGRALPGWLVSVRDPRGRRLPFGAAGEVHVGGAGVADGYLNRDELTAQRFRVDEGDGVRWYRTGDRGRLRPDGQLDHLGRLDNQVQLRGFRVELDEIRAVLLEDPAVSAAAVVLADGPGGPASARIDAYVVTAGPAGTGEIRRRAGRMLPEYMVPATVTALPELPLTINGKVDVARLPAPASQAAPPESAAAPATVTGQLQRIWAAILGTAVGVDDDFFELGGNSLLAVRLMAALRDAGLPAVPARELYLRPTIAALAGVMRGGEA
jgi:amino acid adenylation domain-containing protein